MKKQNFEKLAKDFRKIIKDLGIKKGEIEDVIEIGGEKEETTEKILNKLASVTKNTQNLLKKHQIPEFEKKRRLAELKDRIELLELIRGTEPDFDKRMEAERELTRRVSQRGVLESLDIFHFENLLDPNGDELATLLKEAEKDIKARKNLRRVLKGIEIVSRVAAFGASSAAKIAV
jgi:hypothetical protein